MYESANAPQHYKIRCNNCDRLFEDDFELAKLFEEPANPETGLDGCPDCKTDEYLMNLGERNRALEQ
jgi:hypothetical protein